MKLAAIAEAVSAAAEQDVSRRALQRAAGEFGFREVHNDPHGAFGRRDDGDGPGRRTARRPGLRSVIGCEGGQPEPRREQSATRQPHTAPVLPVVLLLAL